MGMGDGDGQSIGSVIILWRGVHLQQVTNHILNLLLFSPAITSQRLFDFQWSIFANWQLALSTGQQQNTARLSYRNSGSGIFIEKQLFYSCLLYTSQI